MDSINKGYVINRDNAKFYAVTSQKDNFKVLDANKVLAVAEVAKTDESTININYLQVDPMQLRGAETAEFRHIGTAILNAIKDLYPFQDIYLRSTNSAKRFYKSQGFEKLKRNSNEFIFRRMKF